MLKINKKKTVKVAMQVATFVSVSVCLAAIYNNYIPVEYANKLVVRIGKAVITYVVLTASVDGVGKLLDDVFDENYYIN